jgi:hypothetical protein
LEFGADLEAIITHDRRLAAASDAEECESRARAATNAGPEADAED